MVWARCFIAFLVFFAYFILVHKKTYWKSLFQIDVLISGVFLGIHWITFFYSIYYSTVAIAAISIFTFPLFTAILEPIFTKATFDRIHALFGFLVLLGIYIITDDFSIRDASFVGVAFGLISALAYAIRNIYSKVLTSIYSGSQQMYFQVTIVAILLLPLAPSESLHTISDRFLPLLALGIVPTVIGHALLVESFKYFSAAKAAILTSFQPLFSIFLAAFFLGEIPSFKIYIGGTIIIGVVIVEILRKK